jgi:STE24 endopeptidase
LGTESRWSSLLTSFIARSTYSPLFNTYKPLNDSGDQESHPAMVQANEIPVKQVFEVDASRQTKRVSANVAGFLGTTRTERQPARNGAAGN